MSELNLAVHTALKRKPWEKQEADGVASNLQSGAVYRRYPGPNKWVARDRHGDALDYLPSPKDVDRLLAAGIVETCGSLAEPRDAVRLRREVSA